VDAPVLVVSGSRDHAVDYRSSIALASCYPHGELLILDADHMFSSLKTDGSLEALTRAFLVGGPDSDVWRSARAAIEPHVWRE